MTKIATPLISGYPPTADAGDFYLSATQQIVLHIGGLMRAVIRRRSINWTFHWNGICRALSCSLVINMRTTENTASTGVTSPLRYPHRDLRPDTTALQNGGL
jgi:hypothetical protein